MKEMNEGPYTDPKTAVSDYNSDEQFYAHVRVEMDDSHVSRVQESAFRHFHINLPTDYAIDMLAKNIAVATEAYNDGLDDTDGRSTLADFLANDVLGVNWPIYGDAEEASKEFFDKWRTAIAGRGWTIDK